jgi:hypothetical protein
MANESPKRSEPVELPQLAVHLSGPVYKFRSYDNARDTDPQCQGSAASLLRDNLIYCASPWDMNDPWEGRPAFAVPEGPPDDPNVRAFVKAFIDTLPEPDRPGGEKWLLDNGIENACRLMQDAHHRENKGIGLYSVSASVEHPLQWSYYANGHRGFCWVFENKCPPFAAAAKVRYEPECPTINWAAWRQDNTLLQASLLTKGAHWVHEQEYRVLVPRTSAPDLFDVVPYTGGPPAPLGRYLRIPAHALLGVVLGGGISLPVAGSIARMSRDYGRNLHFYKAGIHRKKYEMAIGELSQAGLARLLDAR